VKGKQVHRKIDRSPEDLARLKAARADYQARKPTPDELLAEGGHAGTIPLGEFLAIQRVLFMLKRERERQALTLAQVADRTGIDTAALSRLETGKQPNPTLETVCRIAAALGKELVCDLRDIQTSA
jgi:DNA-binding XRE family transcriptional regulator